MSSPRGWLQAYGAPIRGRLSGLRNADGGNTVKHSRRSSARSGRPAKGFVLIALLAMLAVGGLYFFISNLSPEFLRNRAQQQTGDSLAQAREALIGYAIRFRDEQLAQGSGGLVYGYLPMPDLGTLASRARTSARRSAMRAALAEKPGAAGSIRDVRTGISPPSVRRV